MWRHLLHYLLTKKFGLAQELLSGNILGSWTTDKNLKNGPKFFLGFYYYEIFFKYYFYYFIILT